MHGLRRGCKPGVQIPSLLFFLLPPDLRSLWPLQNFHFQWNHFLIIMAYQLGQNEKCTSLNIHGRSIFKNIKPHEVSWDIFFFFIFTSHPTVSQSLLKSKKCQRTTTFHCGNYLAVPEWDFFSFIINQRKGSLPVLMWEEMKGRNENVCGGGWLSYNRSKKLGVSVSSWGKSTLEPWAQITGWTLAPDLANSFPSFFPPLTSPVLA